MPDNDRIPFAPTMSTGDLIDAHSTVPDSRIRRLSTLRPRETVSQAQDRLKGELTASIASEHMTPTNTLIASRWKKVIEEVENPSAFDMKNLYDVEWDRGKNDQNVKPIETVMSLRRAMLNKGQDGWRHAKVTLPPSWGVTTVGSKRRGLDDYIGVVPVASNSRRRDAEPTVDSDYTDTRAFEVPDVDDEDMKELVEAQLNKRYWRRLKNGDLEGTRDNIDATLATTVQTTESVQTP